MRDIETKNQGKETLATALVYDDASGRQSIPLTRDDLVFFTNGSMVHGNTYGDNDTVATYNRDTTDLGVFDVWKKLAARDPEVRPARAVHLRHQRKCFSHLHDHNQRRFDVRRLHVRQDGRHAAPHQEWLHHDRRLELDDHLLRVRQEVLPQPARRRGHRARLHSVLP